MMVMRSSSCENTGNFRCSRYLCTHARAYGSQSGSAKFTASLKFSPWLKPAWYALGNVTTNSPALWLQANTRTPASVTRCGFIRVTSWKRRSGCASNRSGASHLIAASNFSASSPGIPYQVFVSPQCTKTGPQRHYQKHG